MNNLLLGKKIDKAGLYQPNLREVAVFESVKSHLNFPPPLTRSRRFVCMAHSLYLEANASLMCNNILGSVSHATLANCPIKWTLENERESKKLPYQNWWLHPIWNLPKPNFTAILQWRPSKLLKLQFLNKKQ